MATPVTPPPTPPRLDFARLAAARRRLGWSQHELAKRALMHVATLNRIEKNRTEPPLSKVIALARALGIPHQDLYQVIG